jgi:group I intron endonuclease
MFSGENASFYGKHHSEEAKRKQSESKKGERNPNCGKIYSEEERKRLSELLSGENNPNYGVSRSEETKQKISQANANPSEVTRQKMREAKIGIYNGANNPRAQTVICLQTRMVYGAASVASEKTGVNANNIRQCCRGERKSAGGYEWKFIYDTAHRNGTLIFGALSLGLITEDEVLQSLTNQND